MAVLLGRVFRKDGSSLMLQIHAEDDRTFPRRTAVAILADRSVGWRTTPEVNQASRSLPALQEMTFEHKVISPDSNDLTTPTTTPPP